LAMQRFFNLLCLSSGGDPQTFADIVEEKFHLPERAADCPREYAQVAQRLIDRRRSKDQDVDKGLARHGSNGPRSVIPQPADTRGRGRGDPPFSVRAQHPPCSNNWRQGAMDGRRWCGARERPETRPETRPERPARDQPVTRLEPQPFSLGMPARRLGVCPDMASLSTS